MAFEDLDTEGTEGQEFEVEEQIPPPEESSNRTFIIVAAILGGVTLLALLCIAVYALVILPRQRSQRETEIARLNAQNTQVALALTQTAAARAFTATPTVTPVPLHGYPTCANGYLCGGSSNQYGRGYPGSAHCYRFGFTDSGSCCYADGVANLHGFTCHRFR